MQLSLLASMAIAGVMVLDLLSSMLSRNGLDSCCAVLCCDQLSYAFRPALPLAPSCMLQHIPCMSIRAIALDSISKHCASPTCRCALATMQQTVHLAETGACDGSHLCFPAGGRNKWRLHPYFPIDVRVLSTTLLGLGAYLYFHPLPDQHQPNAGDGRVFGSPDSQEPEPQQLEDPEGEPIPLDMGAVAKHAQRLGQHSNSKSSSMEWEQHQPNAADGRVLGSSDSQEPTPRQNEHGEPLPFDEAAAAKHAQRLQQQSKGEGEASQGHQPNAGDGRILGSAQSQEPETQLSSGGEPLPFDDSAAAQHAKRLGQHAEQQQPNAGDGRVFGSSDSQEPTPEQLDNGEPLPVDDSAVAQHAQRLSQHSNQHQSPDAAQQHQPNAGDGRILGSEQSQEPKPKQQADGEPLPLDLDAVDKHQQRLEAATRQREGEASQHQPRVGDGRKLGSPDSVEPEPVELDSGEPHQPRVGDGRKMGSPDSKEPKAVVADSGEPMPLDEEAVARHQRRLEERVKQDQARHENAHDDEFAISGKQGPPCG